MDAVAGARWTPGRHKTGGVPPKPPATILLALWPSVFWDFGSLYLEALRRLSGQLLRQRHSVSFQTLWRPCGQLLRQWHSTPVKTLRRLWCRRLYVQTGSVSLVPGVCSTLQRLCHQLSNSDVAAHATVLLQGFAREAKRRFSQPRAVNLRPRTSGPSRSFSCPRLEYSFSVSRPLGKFNRALLVGTSRADGGLWLAGG